MMARRLVYGERFEDVFQDEIIMAFDDITSFKRFARSKNGLCLDDHILQQIVEDHGGNVEEQKLKMLNKWREITGEKATVSKIRYLLQRYLRGDKGDYIVLENGRYGIYKKHVLCKHGQVFLGEQTSEVTGSYICAIKLHEHNEKNLREAKILSKLRNHVNVVSVLYAGIHHGDPHDYIFIAMDLCWTSTVRNMLEDSDRLGIPFNEYISMNLVGQILRALDFIHSNNIIHRDLKPENILLSKDWSQSKLTDFGISKTITDGHSTRQTNANIGTEGYRSPETYITNTKISLKSDVFSAGVTIAEISSNGKHPYGSNPYLWSNNIINNQNFDLSHLLVPQILNLIKRMLEMNPEKRPTAKEVLNEVQQFQTSFQQKNQQTTADQSSATSSMTQPQSPTPEIVLNKVRRFQAWSPLKNQQTAADQSSAISSIVHLHRSTVEKAQYHPVSIQPWNQLTTASATSPMAQLQRPIVEEVLNDDQQLQTSFQSKNQQTTAIQSSATSSMTQLSVTEKVNAIIMFNKSDNHMYSYKPSTNEWSRMQEFAIVGDFTAVVSGKHIYMMIDRNVCQLEYSHPTAKWKRIASLRRDHGLNPPAAVLNGSIYVCGGIYSGVSSLVDRYRAPQDQWDFICNMIIERYDPCVVASEDHIYCMGGRNEEGEFLQTVERFDERCNEWELVASTPRPIKNASAAVVKNRIYVADYKGVLCYNIQCDSWREVKLSIQWPFNKFSDLKMLAVNKKLYIGECFKLFSIQTVDRISLQEPETSRMNLLVNIDNKNIHARASLAVKL